MKLYKNKTNILILTHYTFRSDNAEDTDQRIVTYLKNRVKKIVHITQPLPEYGNRHSYCLVYNNGKVVKKEEIKTITGPIIFQYLHHTILIYYFLLKYGISYDLCITMENLSFIGIWPLRLIGRVKRLIYYSIDFVPQRFPNHILNTIYKNIFIFSNKFSDKNWVLVNEQIKAARKMGIKNTSFKIVPIGYETKNITVLNEREINLNNIIYAGAIRESMGPELAIKSMPLLIKNNPKIKLTLIGKGKDLEYLKNLSKKIKVDRHVNFLGYVESFDEMTSILSKHSLGLAPYKPLPGSFSYYSDPSKIKLYMVCGLPVITTNVTTMAPLITKTRSGRIINYNEKSLQSAVTSLISNLKIYKQYKQNAIKLAANFDINNILNSAIKNLS